jgi:hypothetical protein
MTDHPQNDVFVLLFLDGESDSVHAEQAEEIDLFKVLLHLNNGGSVFISNRRRRDKELEHYGKQPKQRHEGRRRDLVRSPK